MHYTYMVQCRDGSLYTGYTTDVFRREKEHNLGRGAKYTRSRRPVSLVYYEEYETKTDAMGREYDLKQLTREEKLKLIEHFGMKSGDFQAKSKDKEDKPQVQG